MTSMISPPASVGAPRGERARDDASPHALRRPANVSARLGPNWFATVMGTGIVGVAAASLPVQVPGLRTFGTAVWALAAVLLVVLLAAWAVHWIRHTAIAKGHAHDPVMAQFWGTPPMALMTVGTGALLLGRDLIGSGTALVVAAVLWTAGTLLGLVTTVWIPVRMMTTHDTRPDDVFAGWLLPVVPPMVSAATGALLVPHLPAGQARLTMLLACGAMFGISLFATLIIVPQVWQGLVWNKAGPAVRVPTVWIVLGPLGQSVTAANLLADAAGGVLPGTYARAAGAFAVFYAVPAWGFAIVWLVIAVTLTVRTARVRLPFALTWWSFTFPLGTVVTGSSALAWRLDADLFTVAAVVLFAMLVTAWATVTIRTARGVHTGSLFR